MFVGHSFTLKAAGGIGSVLGVCGCRVEALKVGTSISSCSGDPSTNPPQPMFQLSGVHCRVRGPRFRAFRACGLRVRCRVRLGVFET